MNLCELEASLVYKASSRKAKDTQRNPASETKSKAENKKRIFYKSKGKILVRYEGRSRN